MFSVSEDVNRLPPEGCARLFGSTSGMAEAVILESNAGSVRLLRPQELYGGWDPKDSKRFTMWQATRHMVRMHDRAEPVAVAMMDRPGSAKESACAMAHHPHHICEQRDYSQESQDHNTLVQNWPGIAQMAKEIKSRHATTSSGELKQHDDL